MDKRKLRENRRKIVLNLYASGLTYRAIGEIVERHETSIRHTVQRAGVPQRPVFEHDAEFVVGVRRLWDEGDLSMRQIALKLNVTKGVIAGIRHRNNFPNRREPLAFRINRSKRK